jgi:hypothetical protein
MTIRIPRWSLVAAAVFSGLALIGGIASAAGTSTTVHATAARLKPAATSARVHGLRFEYGNPVTATPVGSSPYGVVTEAISVALCPRGLHALSGGWNSADTTEDPVTITSNEVGRGLNRWFVVAKDLSTSDTSAGFTFQATVMCG